MPTRSLPLPYNVLAIHMLYATLGTVDDRLAGPRSPSPRPLGALGGVVKLRFKNPFDAMTDHADDWGFIFALICVVVVVVAFVAACFGLIVVASYSIRWVAHQYPVEGLIVLVVGSGCALIFCAFAGGVLSWHDEED